MILQYLELNIYDFVKCNRHLKGHAGFCFAFRRAAIEKIGFYDYLILGGADTFMAFAIL